MRGQPTAVMAEVVVGGGCAVKRGRSVGSYSGNESGTAEESLCIAPAARRARD